MRIAVHVFFEFNSKTNKIEIEVESSPHFMDWKYPQLPRVGEYICQPARFLSAEAAETFKGIKVKDFFINDESDPLLKHSRHEEEDSLFDFYDNANSDRFLVESIEWLYDEEEEGHYPLINIAEQ
jgi:hypothetical protein